MALEEGGLEVRMLEEEPLNEVEGRKSKVGWSKGTLRDQISNTEAGFILGRLMIVAQVSVHVSILLQVAVDGIGGRRIGGKIVGGRASE